MEAIIHKLYRAENVIRRLQLIYEDKQKKIRTKNGFEIKNKYSHLSLFGFYLQLSQRDRQLYLIDWPIIQAPLSFDMIYQENSLNKTMQLAMEDALKLCEPIPPPDQITKAEQDAIQDKITTARDMAAVNFTLKKVDESFAANPQGKISLEELIYHIENYQRAEQQLRCNQLEMVRKAKLRAE